MFWPPYSIYINLIKWPVSILLTYNADMADLLENSCLYMHLAITEQH